MKSSNGNPNLVPKIADVEVDESTLKCSIDGLPFIECNKITEEMKSMGDWEASSIRLKTALPIAMFPVTD